MRQMILTRQPLQNRELPDRHPNPGGMHGHENIVIGAAQVARRSQLRDVSTWYSEPSQC